MRRQFVATLSELFVRDERLFLMLGDIGVHGFRALLQDHPSRALNFGILEQAMVGAAAGISSEGLIPVVHTIAPFMIERAYEQIKIDLGYQKLSANLVSVGGSYDYAALGCTHHCPADVSLVRNIPDARVILPGTPGEFDNAFRTIYENGINYFRLSEESHNYGDLPLGVTCLKKSTSPQIVTIFIGPALRFLDLESIPQSHSVIYLNYIADDVEFVLPDGAKKCNIIQDFYSGPVEDLLLRQNIGLSIRTLAPKRKFIESYGSREGAYSIAGLSKSAVLEFLQDE